MKLLQLFVAVKVYWIESIPVFALAGLNIPDEFTAVPVKMPLPDIPFVTEACVMRKAGTLAQTAGIDVNVN